MIAQSSLLHREPYAEEGLEVEIPTVFVIDPDPATGRVVSELVDGHRIEVQSHTCGRSFFAAYDGTQRGCLVLELRILDASGF
jgi:FixJ family two-component response regulator